MNKNLILECEYQNRIDFSKYYNSINIILQLILYPIPLCHKLTSEDWKQLFDYMDIMYGDALKRWLTKYDNLSDEEIAFCYFCRIGIGHANLAIFFCVSPQNLSKRKQRLKIKLRIPQKTSLEDVVKRL